ncbi:MAG TPA: response regulator transcription factor [Candidatus Tetragenococcus pullicola]|nr:response regulator transcription factor [Candidatus Tetragenococcus pullicola]
MKKVLIVEDDNSINGLLYDLLEDYEVTQAFAGSEAKRILEDERFDLILLDLMLPGINGEDLILWIRQTHQTPIIVITARSEASVLSSVLEAGANDYIAKPFNTVEVLARVKNQLRDFSPSENQLQELQLGSLKMNEETHTVSYNDQPLDLTQKEYELLRCFLQHPKKVFTKANLYETVWQEPYFGDDNTVMVHISRLRKKLQKVTDKEIIKTIWGVGFQLD